MVRSKFELERTYAIMRQARIDRNEALQDLRTYVQAMVGDTLCPNTFAVVRYLALERAFETALTAYVGAQATIREGWLAPENVALLTEE